jgi:hypothetical protein
MKSTPMTILKFLLILFIFPVVIFSINAQSTPAYIYNHDASGNRISRISTMVYPIKGDTTKPQIVIGKTIIKIFPNPVKDILDGEMDISVKGYHLFR